MLLTGLGSMQVAVILLLYLGVLTFVGTVAQVDLSAYDVQKLYFESWTAPLWGPVHGPGGLPTMAALFVNLLCGGVLRVRWHRRNLGILVAHLGILLLLVAGWVKHQFSVSGMVALFEGQSGTAFQSFTEWELALLRQDGTTLRERTVPGEALAEASRGSMVEVLAAQGDARLPFRVFVHHWRDNCEPTAAGSGGTMGMPVVGGAFLRPLDTVLRRREANIAGCYVDVVPAPEGRLQQDQKQQGILWGFESRPMLANDAPWSFEVAGQRYGLMLRRKTWDLPFAVRLDRFSKEDHPGSGMARDFSSYVTVRHNEADRPVRIFMNNPLRLDGHVVYQTQFGQDPRDKRFYSVFEVGRNPSDKWPEYACYVIAVGLVYHFLLKLRSYIGAQARQRTEAA